MRHRPALVIAAFLVAAASPAAAHRLKVFATVVGASVEGKAYFVGGGPAGNVSAVLENSAGGVVVEGSTGADGRFALVAPVRDNLAVVVDAKDGHVARFEIAADRLPDPLPGTLRNGPMSAAAAAPGPLPPAAGSAEAGPPAALPAAAIETALARQLEPLSEQVDALQSSIRLHDVVGGVGYIAGIFGLLAFLKARRR